MNVTTELYSFQQVAVDKLIRSRIAGLFMEMGTGKTRTAIEFVYLRQNRIKRVVWFCPVSLKETIRQEIKKHTDSSDQDIVVFDDKTSEKRLNKNAFWYIVGIESMSSSNRVVFAVNSLIDKQTMVIIDESSYLKGHNSKRTMRITEIAKPAKYRMLLTGTPISQGVVDLYSQLRFLSPKILGYRSFYSFARNHLEYSDKYKGMIVAAHNVPLLAAKMQPYVYQITKDECLDLPNKLYDVVYHGMTDEQNEYYAQVKTDMWEISEQMYAKYGGDAYIPTLIFQLFTRLQLVASGIYIKPEENIRLHLDTGRIDSLEYVLSGINHEHKVIVWCKYVNSLENIVERLQSRYDNGCVAQFHGGLSESKRNAEVKRFQEDAGTRFFVATQSSGGHGLTLNQAHHVIFYENGFKYSERIQAEDRCHRIGQTQPVTYIDLVCSYSIDQKIMDSIRKKSSVVAEFRREVEKVKSDRRGALKRLVNEL